MAAQSALGGQPSVPRCRGEQVEQVVVRPVGPESQRCGRYDTDRSRLPAYEAAREHPGR
jgi:hypothetical protein